MVTGFGEPEGIVLFSQGKEPPSRYSRKWINAIGGADRVANVTSFVATGSTRVQHGCATVPIEIFAKAPDQRSTVVRVFDATRFRTTDGRNAWAAEAGRQLPLMTLLQQPRERRVEAMLDFRRFAEGFQPVEGWGGDHRRYRRPGAPGHEPGANAPEPLFR